MEKEYIIRWKCDGTEEIYETKGERSGRINTLENQGYEMWTDFDLITQFVCVLD